MLRDGMIFLFSRIAEVWCLLLILRPLENPKKQSDGGGRLNPSRFLFRLAFLSWPWRWYDVSLCFCKIPEFSGSYVDRVSITKLKLFLIQPSPALPLLRTRRHAAVQAVQDFPYAGE